MGEGKETSMEPLSGCGCSKKEQTEQQAQSRIDALLELLGLEGPLEASDAVKESGRPGQDFLENEEASDAVVSRIADPQSGKGSDQLCQWLYESYQSGDPDLQAVVLRYIPSLCGVYFSRSCGGEDIDEPLAGFEAVLLALYTQEAKARGGRPIMIHLPSLSHPSIYHTPAPVSRGAAGQVGHQYAEQVSAPLEPQVAVKSTKRADIVGLALELFWRRIAIMPRTAKLEFCWHARRWAMAGCSWGLQVDEIARLALLPFVPVGPPPAEVEKIPALGHALATGESLAVSQAVLEQPPHKRTVEASKASIFDEMPDALTSSVGSVSFNSATSSVEQLGDENGEVGVKLPLSLDLLRPIFKVLGHCLMGTSSTGDLKHAAVSAARALYVRASEDLIPEAILASRSLVRLGAALAADAQAPKGTRSPSPNIIREI